MGANVLKCCNLHDETFFLDNGVMTTPKRRILSFLFTILCFKKSLLIALKNNTDNKSCAMLLAWFP